MTEIYCKHFWGDPGPYGLKLCARCQAVWMIGEPEPEVVIAYMEKP